MTTAPRPPERRPWLDAAVGEPFDMVLRLTLVMILLFPGDLWFHRICMRILAVCGFASPRLARHPRFWFLLFAINLAIQNLYNWAVSDNHTWLFSYWYLAIGLAAGSDDPGKTLATSGRLLLSLTFVFATLKKALAPDYLNGSAFRYLLLTDPRFFEVARLLGDHTQDPHLMWKSMSELKTTVALPSTPSLDRLAAMLTWWTLDIEALIGLLFLPDSGRIWLVTLRNWLLLVFVATTYPIAPVIGFAWILLIMGLAQCPASLPKTRMAYLVVFILTYASYGEQIKVYLLRWFCGEKFYVAAGSLLNSHPGGPAGA